MTGLRVLPDDPIQGDGFRLRTLTVADAPDVTAACVDPETQRWLPLPNPYTESHAIGFITEVAVNQHETGDGVVFGIEVDGRLHGCIDLKGSTTEGVIEIGYWVAPWGRGQGLAGRAAGLLGRWALREQHMERVVIRAATGNHGSNAAAVRAGFTREGIARNAGHTHDGRVDLVIHSLVPADLADH